MTYLRSPCSNIRPRRNGPPRPRPGPPQNQPPPPGSKPQPPRPAPCHSPPLQCRSIRYLEDISYFLRYIGRYSWTQGRGLGAWALATFCGTRRYVRVVDARRREKKGSLFGSPSTTAARPL